MAQVVPPPEAACPTPTRSGCRPAAASARRRSGRADSRVVAHPASRRRSRTGRAWPSPGAGVSSSRTRAPGTAARVRARRSGCGRGRTAPAPSSAGLSALTTSAGRRRTASARPARVPGRPLHRERRRRAQELLRRAAGSGRLRRGRTAAAPGPSACGPRHCASGVATAGPGIAGARRQVVAGQVAHAAQQRRRQVHPVGAPSHRGLVEAPREHGQPAAVGRHARPPSRA